MLNTQDGRAKVGAKFGAITELYRAKHLPTLRHSTQQTNRYFLKDYIEPRWTDEPLQDVTPLMVLGWLGELDATTKAAIRSIVSQCFQLAALHGYTPATGGA